MDVKELTVGQPVDFIEGEIVDEGSEEGFEGASTRDISFYVPEKVTNRSYDFLNRFGGEAFESKRYEGLQGFAALKYADQTDEKGEQDLLKGRMRDHLASSC